MCWCNKEKSELKVADKDIPVFKIAIYNKDDTISSYYRNFEYEEGKSYHTKLGKLEEYYNSRGLVCCKCMKGFHSYSKDYCIIFEISVINEDCEILDFFPELTSRVCQLVQLNCVIPKGSKYYLNYKGEYISDNIKIISKDVLDE